MTKSLFIVESDVASLDQSASRAAAAARTRDSAKHVVWNLMIWHQKSTPSRELVSQQRVLKVCVLVYVAVVGAVLSGTHLFGQVQTPANRSESLATQTPILQVESKLVIVPVFVYAKYGLELPLRKEEKQCYDEDAASFYALSPEQPFIPSGCYMREIKDLDVDDFTLYEGGEPQKLRTFSKGNWELVVRDNQSWQIERSDAPSGFWSTTDLDHSFYPWERQFYYLLGYEPSISQGGCHHIRVTVRRPQKAEVYARDEYCAEQTPSDLLNGTKRGEELERRLTKEGRQGIPLFLQTGIFHRKEAGQRLDVVLEFPWDQLIHHWDLRTGAFDARIGILGAVYTKDGKLISRFSDLLWPRYWPAVLGGIAYTGTGFARGDQRRSQIRAS